MSDERDLTPEQEARVARLLADARVEEPLPPEVAARLDQVLAGLAGEPVAGPARVARVVDLAARRRRRVRMLLVAAAAVVVAGVGVGQLVEPRGSDSDDAGAARVESTDEDGDRAGDEQQREASPEDDGPGLLTQGELESLGEPARISASKFAASVRRLQDRPGVRSDAETGMIDDRDLAAPEMDFSCGAADYGTGKLIAVRYQGSPAVLAYRPAAGDTQVVELLQCGSGEVIRSTTVPLP